MQTLSDRPALPVMTGIAAQEQHFGSDVIHLVLAGELSSSSAQSVMDSQRYDRSGPVTKTPRSLHDQGPRLAVTRLNHRAQRALRQIEERRKATEAEHRHMEEMQWIRANRICYAGKWVALIGSQLQASGSSAKEVFHLTSAVSGATPLVILIDEEPLPFAGW